MLLKKKRKIFKAINIEAVNELFAKEQLSTLAEVLTCD